MRESIHKQKSDPGHARVSSGRSNASVRASVSDTMSTAVVADPMRIPETLHRLSQPGTGSLRVQYFRNLQRSYGNQAVMRMMERATGPTLQKKCAPCAAGKGLCPKCANDEARLHRKAVEGQTPIAGGMIQAKLTIGQPNDRYEQEADRTADQVMRMPAPTLQRACGSCASGKGPKYTGEESLTIHRRAADQAESGGAPSVVHEVLGSSGQPLDSAARSFMEPRFGYDFSHVRVHTDSKAAESARSVNALAYTVGRDVVFGAGQYAPGSSGGRYLLAHELTHVVQQGKRSAFLHRLIRSPYPWLGVITPPIGANIRSAPDMHDPTNILDSIPRGERVRVLSASGNWLRVESRYRGPALVGYTYHTLVDDATSSSMAGSVGTQMVWRPSDPHSGTTFQSWASAATETPFPAVTPTTVMNCWEAVLLSAYRARAINWRWIHNLYVSTPMANWVGAMSRGARRTYAIPGPNPTMPQRGDIVFFNGLAHVALATGNGSQVFTFWPPPNTPFFTSGGTPDRVKVFTIEALVTWWTANMPPAPNVEFAAPAW